MAHVVRKQSLSRRAILRGAGVAVALPFLSAMTPALTRSRGARPVRTCFVFAPNGMKMDDWTPSGSGSDFSFGHILEPLDPFRKQVLVATHLAIDGGRAHGDGPGDHARNASTYLTCAHPKKTGGKDIHVGVSVDQVIAADVGSATRFPSLELGMERGKRSGSCDSGYACAYSNNVSWRTATTPVTKETNPREVFIRLFGDPGEIASQKELRASALDRRSILDAALGDARRLRRRLGAVDRAKLDQYLDSVREVEARLKADAEAEPDTKGMPVDVLDGASRGYASRLGVMYDLVALAFEADLTRTVTFMLGGAGSNRSYRMAGVTNGHHTLSHHGKKPSNLEGIRRINRWHAERFAEFLKRLAETGDEDSDLLRQSMVVFGSGLGDGNRHDHMNVPVLVAGSGGGRLRTGRHLILPRRTPMANLHLSLMGKVGVHRERFADSTGTLGI
ncbi:MAG: DUF1552 domain-containing protein [Planctomycetota bacterium]|nr:DUF1552 domain-containing protein [Planctomycetota bacterium]